MNFDRLLGNLMFHERYSLMPNIITISHDRLLELSHIPRIFVGNNHLFQPHHDLSSLPHSRRRPRCRVAR